MASAAVARLRSERAKLTGPLAVHDLLRRARARGYAALARMELPEVGPGCTIEPSALLIGTRRIHLGPGTNISAHARLKTSADGEIHIGAKVWIGPNVVLNSSRRLEIGDRALLAGNCFLSTHRHARAGAEFADVTVGAGAWLGSNVVLAPGVTVGPGAVVGANSVVTRDVPANHVSAGAPARVLRSLD